VAGALPPARRGPTRSSLGAAALPVVAIATLAIAVGATVWAAAQAGTLGYDYSTYDAAVRRFLAGGALYDASFQVAGPKGLFFYPPPFVLLAIPLALLDPGLAAWAFSGLLTVAFIVAVAILPVSGRTRWSVLLLGGLSWPLLYAVKLGQVGPILLLLFAAGWRRLGNDRAIGISAAVGAVIKLQPALVLAWAALLGRWRAVAAGAAALGVLAVAATIVTGVAAWGDWAALLSRLSQPVTTPAGVTPGRIAFEAGLPESAATIVQYVHWVLLGVAVLVAVRLTPPAVSYLVAVVVSQAASPILWDHYALVLLLPVAWLLERGRWWAAAIPLATSVVLVGLIPGAVYPLAYWVTIVALLVEGRRAAGPSPRAGSAPAAGSSPAAGSAPDRGPLRAA
jgi:alpha-1,2-mannosyltransferase